MDINSINNSYATSAYSYQTKNTSAEKSTASKAAEETGVVYEKNTDRTAIIEKMKSDVEQRTAQMKSLVESMMKNQGVQIGTADDIWHFLASGNFTVTEAAKAQAQEAISENGYWGVEQTSERIVEFAKALTGGDASKAEEMRDAFIKGFKEATKSWGKELPSISQDTYDAVMKKFDKWVGKDTEAVEA